MNLDKMTPAYGTLFVFALFLICVSGNALFDTSAYAQIMVDNSNATNATWRNLEMLLRPILMLFPMF